MNTRTFPWTNKFVTNKLTILVLGYLICSRNYKDFYQPLRTQNPFKLTLNKLHHAAHFFSFIFQNQSNDQSINPFFFIC